MYWLRIISGVAIASFTITTAHAQQFVGSSANTIISGHESAEPIPIGNAESSEFAIQSVAFGERRDRPC